MPNLNKHDLIFLSSKEFEGFSEYLEQQYNFKITSITFPEFISFTSRKAILETNEGIFFMKEKPQYCSDKLSLARSVHFQEYVASQLEIVPEIIVTKEQDYYVTWNKKHYFLTVYKKGRHYNGSLKDLDFMIKGLHALQECGNTYLKKHRDSRQDELSRFESFEIASGIYNVEIKSSDEQILLNEIVSLYENLRTEYVKIPKEQYVMSHSDFIIFNVVLNEGGLVAINDFDNVKVLPRIHDMAEFLVSASLINYIAPLTNLKFPLLIEPDKTVFLHIMKQYVQRFNLSNDELTLLGYVAEIVWLWTLVLAVFKGDYSLDDLKPALEILREGRVRILVDSFQV